MRASAALSREGKVEHGQRPWAESCANGLAWAVRGDDKKSYLHSVPSIFFPLKKIRSWTHKIYCL